MLTAPVLRGLATVQQVVQQLALMKVQGDVQALQGAMGVLAGLRRLGAMKGWLLQGEVGVCRTKH